MSDPAGSQVLRAVVEASVDTIHPLVAQRDARGTVRSFTAYDGADVTGEPWFDQLAFLGAMESGTAREDRIEGSGTTLLRRVAPHGDGVTVCVRDLEQAGCCDNALHRAENAALRRVATTVAGQADSEVVFDQVAREVAQLLGAESGRVARFEGDEAEVVGIWGDEAGSRDLQLRDGRAVSQVASSGRPARVDDYEALRARDPATAEATPETYRSSVAAPVFVGHQLWGGVVAISTSTARAFDEQDEGRLERFSELLAMAIANADERAQLEAAANVDGLTALANHRAFQERLASEVKRARRYGRQLSLAIFDIDHFKQVNLVHGHEAGDRLLAEVGRRMNAVSRAGR